MINFFQSNSNMENAYESFDLAPIVLFVYNRPKHTAETLKALRSNIMAKESDLYVFSDGPKDDNQDTVKRINEVRKIIHEEKGFKNVYINESEVNRGLGKSIISGVSEVINKFGKVIVLEDDIVTSRFFLLFMNQALDKYKNEEKVMQISGYTPPFDKDGMPETFFMSWPDCWGWATWKRVWDNFERNPQALVNSCSKEEIYRININGTNSGMWNQVIDNYEGRIYTWAIFFHSMVVKNMGLTLYSKESLVNNIGFDGSGDNCGANGDYATNIKKDEVILEDIDIRRFKKAELRNAKFNKYLTKEKLLTKIKKIIKKIIR